MTDERQGEPEYVLEDWGRHVEGKCYRRVGLSMASGLVLAEEAPAPSVADYALTITHASLDATWQQSARVETVPAGESFTVTLRDVNITATAGDADAGGGDPGRQFDVNLPPLSRPGIVKIKVESVLVCCRNGGRP